jgi:hypothetical protein
MWHRCGNNRTDVTSVRFLFESAATRTILSGGGEELIELARTNLRELEVE